jgi:hypothetical protein
MDIITVIPKIDCKYCHGTGEVAEHHPYGSTYATEYLICECLWEQVPEDYDGTINIEFSANNIESSNDE